MKDFKVIYRDKEDRATLVTLNVFDTKDGFSALNHSEEYLKKHAPLFDSWNQGPIIVEEIERSDVMWN